jgi:hypothetical protein
MKKISLAVFLSLSAMAGATFAQESGVTMSTDPAKAAAIEQRAQEIKSQSQAGKDVMPVKPHTGHHMKKHKAKAHKDAASAAQ